MNKRSTRCSRPWRARGLTLIEVVAAIAILGTLLVGVVLAKSRHTRQLERARAQAGAVQAADALIADWWTRPQGVPIDDRGTVPGDPDLSWRTRLVDNRSVAALGARVVRVEVYPGRDAPRRARSGEDHAALVVVDLVVPDPEVQAREKKQAEEAEAARQAAGEQYDD